MNQQPSTDSLKALTQLAQKLVDAETEIETAEAALKEKKETARVLREVDIPAFMQELELTQIKLETGEVISIVSEVFASVVSAVSAPISP